MALASCVVLLTATPTAAEWHRIDSPHFVVVGDASAASLREMAVRFEGFRETLTRLLSARATATTVPTVVIVFPSDRAFTPFKPRYRGKPVDLSGVFVPGRDINYIAIVDSGDGDGLRIVFHEYAHLVISNAARRMPLWLNEGLAEYYSTYEVNEGGTQATIGRPIADHLALLKEAGLFRLDALLRIEPGSPLYNEGNRRSLFYAQSWALTHLILLGDPVRTDLLQTYLNTLWAGVPSRDAWRQTFGSGDMDRELARYVRQSAFKGQRFTFPEKLATFDTTSRPLAASDTHAFLADFLLQQERTAEAAERLGAAMSMPAVSPWTSTVAALLDLARDDFVSAQQRLIGVAEGADWLAAYRAGVAVSHLGSEGAATEEHLDAARRLFTAARVTRSELPHAVASLATLELGQAPQPSLETRTAIERARSLAPGRHEYVFLHARILARQSAFAAARHALAPLMSPVYPRHVRDEARQLMGQIVERETAAQAPGAGHAGAAHVAVEVLPN